MLLKFFLQVFILKNFKLQKNCKNNAVSQTLSLLAFCHICTLSLDHNFANPFENYLETLYCFTPKYFKSSPKKGTFFHKTSRTLSLGKEV